MSNILFCHNFSNSILNNNTFIYRDFQFLANVFKVVFCTFAICVKRLALISLILNDNMSILSMIQKACDVFAANYLTILEKGEIAKIELFLLFIRPF